MTTFTPTEIREEIRRLIANLTEREPEEISDSADFTEELGVDSLMAMEVMIAVDRKFKVDIPEEEFNKAKTIDDSVSMVQRWMTVRDAAPVGA